MTHQHNRRVDLVRLHTIKEDFEVIRQNMPPGSDTTNIDKWVSDIDLAIDHLHTQLSSND